MIIAVDFDGILCENEFPKIGKPNYEMIIAVREAIDLGHEVILWTSRVEKELDAALEWCDNYGLHFCAVNSNAPSNEKQYQGVYSTAPRKIFADVYIDDHDLFFTCCNHIMRSEYFNKAVHASAEQLRRIIK